MKSSLHWRYAGIATTALLLTVASGIVLTSCGKSGAPQQVATGPQNTQTTNTAPTTSSATAPQPGTPEAADMAKLKALMAPHMALSDGDFSETLPVALENVKKYPNNAEAKYAAAYCMQRMHKQLPEAIKLYDEAEAQGFSKFWVNFHRGLIYMDIGQYDKALSNFEVAKSAAPNMKLRADMQQQIDRASREGKKG